MWSFGWQTSAGWEASLSHDATLACLVCAAAGLCVLLSSFLFSLEIEVVILGTFEGAAQFSHFFCNKKNIKFSNIYMGWNTCSLFLQDFTAISLVPHPLKGQQKLNNEGFIICKLHLTLLGWLNHEGQNMGRTGSMHGEDEKCIQNYGHKMWREETTWET